MLGVVRWNGSLIFWLLSTNNQAGACAITVPTLFQVRTQLFDSTGIVVTDAFVYLFRCHFSLSLSFLSCQDVVLANQVRFAEDVFLSFSTIDLVTDALPRGFDAILCRHALFHNTNAAVRDILTAVQRSGAQYFVATTLRPIDDSVPSPESLVRCWPFLGSLH
jgi:hypothetical protein